MCHSKKFYSSWKHEQIMLHLWGCLVHVTIKLGSGEKGNTDSSRGCQEIRGISLQPMSRSCDPNKNLCIGSGERNYKATTPQRHHLIKTNNNTHKASCTRWSSVQILQIARSENQHRCCWLSLLVAFQQTLSFLRRRC